MRGKMPNLPEIKKILYATDLGDNVRPVFKFALSMARKYDAKIIMLHVVEPMSSAMQAMMETYLTDMDAKKVHQDGMKRMLTTMKQRLETACAEELDTHNISSSRVTEILVASGKTSEEILKAAEKHGVDIIVMGKSRRNIFGSDVAGSAARRVSRYSNIPVVIVPNL